MDRELQAQIEMSNEADSFISSPLGQYILGRCNQIIENAKNELANVSPDDADNIRELQNKIWKAGAVPAFLTELLAEGRQALHVIESTDEFMED